ITPDEIDAHDDHENRPVPAKNVRAPKVQQRESADADQQPAEQVHSLLQKQLQPLVLSSQILAPAQTQRRLKRVVNRVEVESDAPESERDLKRHAEDVREHPQSHDGHEMRQRLDVLSVVSRAQAGNESEQQREQWRFFLVMNDAAPGGAVASQRLD